MALIVTDREAKAKAQMKTVYDRKAKEKTFEPGELVLVKKPSLTGKMLSKWEGPYQIMKKMSSLTYAVGIPGRKKHAVLHTKQFHTPVAQVHGIAVIEDDGLDSSPGMKLVREGNILSDDDIIKIELVLKVFSTVLTETPGLTQGSSQRGKEGGSPPFLRQNTFDVVRKPTCIL